MITTAAQYVVTESGSEWGFFSLEDLQEMGLSPESRNVREVSVR